MSWAAAQRRMEAARKREERTSLKRQKELVRALKEQAKLSAQEQARLQVEAFENSLELLQSVHKEARPRFDWLQVVSALPPPQDDGLRSGANEQERADCEEMRALAKRILMGEEQALGEAVQELAMHGELTTLGSSVVFRVHHSKLIECELKVNGRDVIPAEMKSLTAAGKLSVKAMPKARFHEIYQDYVCGCVLRVARETLALLPVDSVIVTALVSTVQASTGAELDLPVLSVAIPRRTLEPLDFTRLDPSDSMENFLHRVDVKASRRSGEFVAIVPLKPEEIAGTETAQLNLTDALNCVRDMRARIEARLTKPEPGSPSDSEA